MLTVARIAYQPAEPIDVADLVAEANANTPWAEFSLRERRGDGYAATVCDDGDWYTHTAAVTDFLRANRDALRRIRDAGAELQIDMAYWPEDHPPFGIMCRTLEMDENLLEALTAVGAAFALSMYAGEYHPADGRNPSWPADDEDDE